MDETTLINRLQTLEAPGGQGAKSRALKVIPARMNQFRSTRSASRRSLWLRLGTASALTLMALVSFSVLTTPGHAFTQWVGDRIGLGEPGGPPALESLYRNAMRGAGGPVEPAYVLVRGPGPNDGHYEFITYDMAPAADPDGSIDDTHCFQLEFPEARNLFHAGCGLPPATEGLLYSGVGGNYAGDGYQFASGRVSSDVAAVEFEVDGRLFPVELRPVPVDLIERFGISREFKFFIVFLDGDLREGNVTITAKNAAGEPVARQTSTLLDTGSSRGR